MRDTSVSETPGEARLLDGTTSACTAADVDGLTTGHGR
jgi:hypothetical protein